MILMMNIHNSLSKAVGKYIFLSFRACFNLQFPKFDLKQILYMLWSCMMWAGKITDLSLVFMFSFYFTNKAKTISPWSVNSEEDVLGSALAW